MSFRSKKWWGVSLLAIGTASLVNAIATDAPFMSFMLAMVPVAVGAEFISRADHPEE